MSMSHSLGQGNGQLTLLLTLLPGWSRFSNVNIRVNIGEKVERINTSGDPNHMDKQAFWSTVGTLCCIAQQMSFNIIGVYSPPSADDTFYDQLI